MWPAKLPGEGAAMYDACVAMHDTMVELGVAIDGGKDSLSMAARVRGEKDDVVKVLLCASDNQILNYAV